LKRHVLRTFVVTFITAACVMWTIYLFDWKLVGIAVARMQLGMFVSAGLTLIGGIFVVRGLRWLAVLGLPLDRRHFWQSFCANGAASGLATLTPFQIGEIIKIRMIPDHHGSAWRMGVSAFFVERALDLAGVVGMGSCGFALHRGMTWAAGAALLLPLWGSLALCVISPLSRHLPDRLQPYAQLLHYRSRLIGTGIFTVVLWLLYAGLWWNAVRAINVELNFSQISMMLGGVMLAVVATMSPGGLGVAELGSRGIMLWFGKSHADADAAAIALRLLTPLLVLFGCACLVLLIHYRRDANLKRPPGPPNDANDQCLTPTRLD
jgi:uncharacterized membrane protein YbhN (UPF0104 family)